MSPKQYRLLKHTLHRGKIHWDAASYFDQRTLRSVFLRGWILFEKAGFHVTATGMGALDAFQHASYMRQKENWGKPIAKGLPSPPKEKRRAA